ncbi:hypothetical protein Trydic_g1277 [Trypoxylus dichotomus]
MDNDLQAGGLLSAGWSVLMVYDELPRPRIPAEDCGVVVLGRRHDRVLMVHSSVEEAGADGLNNVRQGHCGILIQSAVPHKPGRVEDHW